MDLETKIEKGLRHRWNELHNKKTTILGWAEQYAKWTLPYMFPVENATPDSLMPVSEDSIGAQAVNHLSNRIISTLFPAKSLFFRLIIDQDMKNLIEEALRADISDAEQVKSKLQEAVLEAETQLTKAEKQAEQHLDMVQYRPQAINAAKLLIITGNALVYHPEGNQPVQVYNFRNYHVVRDCSGEVIEFMTRETKAFETFSPVVQAKLREDATFLNRNQSGDQANTKSYNDDTEVTIYTRVLLEADGKFHVTQYADDIKLDTNASYTKKQLRWIPLTWNLVQGEDYGRGLVAEYAGAFHAVNVLTQSLLNLSAIMGDIKFFVDPQSMIDIIEVEKSLPGSFHVGRHEDVGTPQVNKLAEAQFVGQMIERYERQIAQAFLLTTQLTRNAERVTAEEIRRDVEELETSNSGIYSRLAATWQTPTAYIALDDIGFTELDDGIEPRVITGMDSLSRAGEAYNMRLFLTDLGLLNTVPEDIRMGIKSTEFTKQIAQYHQVPYENWIMTQAELREKQQQDLQAQAQLMAQQQEGELANTVAKEAASEGE